jgi:ribosome biogenesis GTPase
MIKGVVTKSTGSWYKVKIANGETWDCRVAGKQKLLGLQLTNPVAVGDFVMVDREGELTQGSIKRILPRLNYVVRQSPRQKHQLHLLAANVDQAFIITTIVQPNLKQGFIDRFLMMTEPYDIPAYIVFNKSDLFGEAELKMFEELKTLYESIGYQVLKTSTISFENVEFIKKILLDKTTLCSGQSGVGKSSLMMTIEPSLNLETEEISDYSGKGQHTTTFAQMHATSFGANIIDTPGIKSLSFNHLEPKDLSHNFRELFKISAECRYANCMHKNEPGCAVKQSLKNGKLHPLRYQNYLQILEEIEDQNYWERHKDY